MSLLQPVRHSGAIRDRIGIYIDGPNLYGGTRRLTGDGGLDIPALVRSIASGREIADVCFWTGVLNQAYGAEAYARQRRFFAAIEQQLPNARIGRANIRDRGDRQVEKGVDVGIALDLVMGAYEDRWDVGIVVSGDGDLARAGHLVTEMGKRFEVVCCARTLGRLLRAEAHRITVLYADDLRAFQR